MGRVEFVLFFSVCLVCDLILSVRDMDLELVNRLAEVLILDDGDGPVLPLNKVGVEEGKKRLDLCLIGKVIGPRPANKDGIERAMKGVWKINHRFQVEELSSKNIFRFFFGCREDRQRVFGGGPWTIDKQLICFVKPMGLGEVSKMNFDFTSFWISINNVSLARMTELFAREWASPPRDSLRFNKKRAESPNNRPIVTMGEASKIISAVERSRPHFSGLTQEQLAPTSILERRERDEEELNGVVTEHGSGGDPELRVRSSCGNDEVHSSEGGRGDKEKMECVPPVVCGGYESSGVPEKLKVKEVLPRESAAVGASSAGLIVESIDEIQKVGPSKERIQQNNKGKGILHHSSQQELSFSHAFQHTFEPLIKAQKTKTWKRVNSSVGRSSKGMPKSSSFPISPKLSHVIVANALNKLSPRSGGGSKRKMDVKCSLADLGFEGQCFTWINKRNGGAQVQERLDRYFCNQRWHELFPSVKVLNGDFLHSDHRPIVATLENVTRRRKYDKKRCFRFETHWLKDPECQEIISRTWLSTDYPLANQDSLIDIFGSCADQLVVWNKSKYGSTPRQVRETQKELDDLLSVSAPLVRMEEVKRLEYKLNDLFTREECYWKLRSRADWLALGDRNTKYFHNKATGRKKKNAIVEIMTEDGRKLSTEEDIVSEIERYFGTIFSSTSPTLQQVEEGIGNVEARVPQKVKIFLWRMYHRALPTNSQLIRPKVLVQPICNRCGEEMESLEHALVFCSSLLPLWTNLRVWHHLYRGRTGSLAELLVYLFDVLSKEEFELISMVWWWVWYDRNSVLFGQKQSRLCGIVELAHEALVEFQGAGVGVEGAVLRSGIAGGSAMPRRWCPPLRGNKEEFELILRVWWWVWYDSNSVLFGQKQSQLCGIVELAHEALVEFQGAGVGVEGAVLRSGVAGGSVVPRRWCPPLRGEFELPKPTITNISKFLPSTKFSSFSHCCVSLQNNIAIVP
ncbi:hypothetical protein F8388_004257 [Cannabis sativa]|uniref:Reverse transcriptase zinc-binding domain-containing protein n=1 Tax=Cannabis sativa TaxID=3483 RepID=A0A7J6F7A3_CANSA|nr:hypothetical protein F8388_004257 [Cannabis sativa]